MDEFSDLLVRYTKKHRLAQDRLPSMASLIQALDHPESADPGVLDYLKEHPDLAGNLRLLRDKALES